MRQAFRVATAGWRQAARASEQQQHQQVAAVADAGPSIVHPRSGYATKAKPGKPPVPPSGGSGSQGRPVSRDVDGATPNADPERFSTPIGEDASIKLEETTPESAPRTPLPSSSSSASSITAGRAGTTPEPTSNPGPADAADLPSNEPTPRSTGREIAPTSGLASQYLDATEVPMSAAEAERTGARARGDKRSLSSIEKKRRLYGRIAMAGTLVGAGVVAWHLGRDWDSEREKLRLGRNVTVEEGLQGRYQRASARFSDTLDYFNKPAWEPLLPDPLPPPHQKPYTLILSLDDLLIHSSWDREHGWRTAKRPGVDYFLAYLSQFYEIVLFTAQPAYTAIPIAEKLDPHMIYILYKLFRDCTRFHDKKIVKDLSYLGRDLSKVVMLDTDPDHFSLQPENAYKMPKWDGRRDDTDLVGMIPFLEAIAIYNVPDVRPTLKNYADKHIPSAWAEVEREQKRALLADWEKDMEKRKGKLGGGFGSMFGLGSGSGGSGGGQAGPPKTTLEAGREIAQKAYLEEQKYWAEHKGEIEKAMEEERQKQIQQMQSSVVNLFSAWTGMQPPPKPEDGMPPPAQGTSAQ